MKKRIIESIPAYFKEMRNKNLLQSTLHRRTQQIELFREWLLSEQLSELSPAQIKQTHFIRFRKFLFTKDFSEKTADSCLRTVKFFLEYLREEDFESDVQKIVNHYFITKGYSLEEIKKSAKKRKIIYSRYTRPAKDLLHLAGSVERAKKAIDKVAAWADSRNLDYAIETVFKKWPEINKLKPKEKQKKPYYRNDPMVMSKTKQKWYVINCDGDWLEFAGDEKEIEWREE